LSLDLDLETINDFASMANVELAAIDRNTTFAQFEKDLRWNQAFHYLTSGP
jgi:L-arabinose isomerase